MRAAARSEHDGVGPGEFVGESLDAGVLQVEDQCHAADLLQVTGLIGVADDPDRLMAGFGEQPLPEQRDLTVTSGDDHSHFDSSHHLHADGRTQLNRCWSYAR